MTLRSASASQLTAPWFLLTGAHCSSEARILPNESNDEAVAGILALFRFTERGASWCHYRFLSCSEAFRSFTASFGKPEYRPFYTRLKTAFQTIEGAWLRSLARTFWFLTDRRRCLADWMAANKATTAGCLQRGATEAEIDDAARRLQTAAWHPAARLVYRCSLIPGRQVAAAPGERRRSDSGRFSPRPQAPQRPGGVQGLPGRVR